MAAASNIPTESSGSMAPVRRNSIFSGRTLPEVPLRSLSGCREALEDVKAYGVNTQSFLSLYQGFQHFRLPFVKGFVPYVESSRLLLVAGDPVCPVESRLALLRGMMELASLRRKKLVILPARGDFKEVCQEHGFDAVFIGREPIFDLQNMPKLSKSIRLAVKRAERLGLRFIPYEEPYRQQVLALCRKWQDTREIPAMQFLFQLKPFNEQEHKKLFLALSPQDEVLGFVACSPIFARHGWYVEDLIRADHAPNGTTELLVTKTLESLAAEGYEMATLALAPLAGLPDRDESHPWLNSLLRIAYKRLSFIYHFRTLEFFKGKFKPSTWEANYMYVYPAGINLRLAKHLIEAFLGESVLAICRHKIERLLGSSKDSADIER